MSSYVDFSTCGCEISVIKLRVHNRRKEVSNMNVDKTDKKIQIASVLKFIIININFLLAVSNVNGVSYSVEMKHVFPIKLSSKVLTNSGCFVPSAPLAPTLTSRRTCGRRCSRQHSAVGNQTIASSYSSCAVMREKPLPTIFDFQLDHGRCVGVEMETSKVLSEISWSGDLCLEELQYGLILPHGIRREFLGGRVAMRRALGELSFKVGPILKNRHGAPSLPTSIRGSITHKNNFAVALVQPHSEGTVGVDLECAKPSKIKNLDLRIMTDNERQYSENKIPEIPVSVKTLLHFSLKEALYKALHPHVHTHIGWNEAEVFPKPDGTADVKLMLHNFPDINHQASVSARWLLLDNGLFLTTAHVLV